MSTVKARRLGPVLAVLQLGFFLVVCSAENLPADLPQNTVAARFEAPGSIHLKGYLGSRVALSYEKRIIGTDQSEILDCFKLIPGTQTYAGEHMGKFFDAAASYLRYSTDPRLPDLLHGLLDSWTKCQGPDGYLGTYLTGERWKNWDLWVHKYDLVGLLSYYRVTKEPNALKAACRVADLLCSVYGDQPGQLSINVSNKTGVQTSILEPFVDLYLATGERKYLDFCHYIIRAHREPGGLDLVRAFANGAKANTVANGKAYEQLSNLTGLSKLYQLTGSPEYWQACEKGWESIRSSYLFATGSASTREHYHPDGHLEVEFENQPGEGCVTFSWIQFNQQLFQITGHPKYLDQVENTTYNHLLAAQHPRHGGICYYTPLNGYKPYSRHITCCRSSITRAISRIPASVIGKVNGTLSVLMYEPFELKDTVSAGGKVTALHLTAESEFPKTGLVRYTLRTGEKASFPLQFRVPSWAKDFRVTTNGKVVRGKPGTYVRVRQAWGKQNEITVSFRMPTETIRNLTSYPGRFAFKRGPQVLSADLGLQRRAVPEAGVLTDSLAPHPLPAGFSWDQAYTVETEASGGEIVLVPFAEAGQTGGRVVTYLGPGAFDPGIIDISNQWRMTAGDRSEFKEVACDDSSWELLPALVKSWDKLGFHAYDGIGWYRKTVVIPTSLKEQLGPSKALLLELGYVNHACEVFLNGRLVGRSGSLPPNYENGSKRPVAITVSSDIVEWDRENVIAVRVYNHEYMGGMMRGPYALRVVDGAHQVEKLAAQKGQKTVPPQ